MKNTIITLLTILFINITQASIQINISGKIIGFDKMNVIVRENKNTYYIDKKFFQQNQIEIKVQNDFKNSVPLTSINKGVDFLKKSKHSLKKDHKR